MTQHPPTEPEQPTTPPASESSADELERLRQGWQRCQADFENYRKRTERERTELWQLATLDVLLKLTPITDNFRRAFAQPASDSAAWRDGIEQIQKQLDDFLASHQLTRIDVAGAAFDPTLHEAISQLPHPTVPEGHVIQEVEAGYRHRDTIVKPTKVVVSTGQPSDTEGSER